MIKQDSISRAFLSNLKVHPTAYWKPLSYEGSLDDPRECGSMTGMSLL